MEKYDAAVLIIAVSRDGWMVVVKDPSFNFPEWKFPGGHRGNGESIAEAASRELYEETGIRIPWRNLLPLSSKKMSGHFKYVYLGIVHSWKGLLKIGSDGEEVKLFTVGEIFKMRDFLRPHKEVLVKAMRFLRKEGVCIA